ncbi:MAG TPA: hypothetical protein VM537_07090 [Anaerolineae bacterium]|nr:hypothetical protein [Anaerolineae bacterium]
MPYKAKGRRVMHKVDGWETKQTAKSPARAKRAVRLLRGIEHGWKPTGKRRKR